MKKLKKSFAVIVILAVAFTFVFGSIASIYDDGQAYAASSLSKPKISLRTSSNKITVSWDKVKSAKKYQVAYKLSTAKKWTYKTTKKLKFTIKGKYNKKYDVKVRAIKGSAKSNWSRTATRKTETQKVPTGKTYDLSKPSKFKKYSSFKIGKTYRLKDPMGTGRTKKVKVEYGDIVNISGEGVTITVRGTTTKGYSYDAQVTPRSISYTYGADPTGTLNQPDPQATLNGNTGANAGTGLGNITNGSKNDEATTPTNPGVQLPDLSGITIPGVDLSNIDWSQVQLPDLTNPNIQIPDASALPNIPGVTDGTTPTVPTIPGVTDGTTPTTPTIPGVTDGTTPTVPTIPGVTDGTTPTTPTIPGATDISSIMLPQTMTVVWSLDDTQPKRGQADLVDDSGNKVRGTVTSLQEILALRQLQANSTKPVWIKIYQDKTVVYESYTKTIQ